MDIVLGVSMTPTTVRMVLVEGEKADGVTVDHDVFDAASVEGSANVAEQVVSAIQGTKESAQTGGHHLKSIGVAWSDHTEAAALRDALAAHGIGDVMLVSEGHAAASLAQAVGRAVGYDTTALLFVHRDAATLSVVQTDDGSVVKVLSRTLHSGDAMAALTEMAEGVATQESPPQGIFVVGSGVDVSSVKAHFEHRVPLPVHAPDDAELALARGAALASAAAPAFEATTVGLAYSQDPDGTTAGSVFAAAETQLAPAGPDVVDEFADTELRPVDEERKPFLLVGSALTSIFVIGVVALVISLAISIRPTAEQRPSPAQSAIVPSSQVPAAPPSPTPVPEAAPLPPEPPPSAETIKAPVPVVQEAPAPRRVFVEQAPAPAAPPPAPAPAAPPPAPAPAAPPPVVTAPVVLPPPVIVFPQRQWPDWDPPKSNWPWNPQNPKPQTPQEPDEPDEPQSPWEPPWEPPDKPQTPQVPQVPQVPQQPQWPQWPGSGSQPGSNPGGYPGSSGGGRGDSDSGGSRGGSRGGSGVPGDINGDGCFLVFCAPGRGRD
ncbi:DUF7159 family protein [Mycolicibacterium sp.]|uniref:DUF7159 family protein n=1 Tax=Mycolicibacterium sp. TaxID=2320850 RepID=UPI003D13BCB6